MWAKFGKNRVKNGVIIMIFAVCLFVSVYYHSAVGEGIKNGIDTCLNLLIPSLFFPMTASAILVRSGVLARFGGCIRGYGAAVFIIILSLVSGYPVGAAAVGELYRAGVFSKRQAEALASVSIGAGPAYIIVGVGKGMFGSIRTGVLLFAVHILSALILAAFTFFSTDLRIFGSISPRVSFADVITGAVTAAVKSMTAVCAFTVLMTAVLSVIDGISPPDGVRGIFALMSEVTNACSHYAAKGAVAIVSGALGFSGGCVILQVLSAAQGAANTAKIIIIRVINGGLSFVLCRAAMMIFPRETAVSVGAPTALSASYGGAFMSVSLVLCSILFLFSAHQRKSKKIVDFFR